MVNANVEDDVQFFTSLIVTYADYVKRLVVCFIYGDIFIAICRDKLHSWDSVKNQVLRVAVVCLTKVEGCSHLVTRLVLASGSCG